MDLRSEGNEVNQHTMVSPTQVPKLDSIKKEFFDDGLTSKLDHCDDFGFEPFHENVFRTLSANLDRTNSIDQVNEAFEKLENCFIENNILTTDGVSKITPKAPISSTVFLKYRDIDDAFIDMFISEPIVKSKNSYSLPKKIDLKHFKDSFFSVNLKDPVLSDNEDSLSKNDTESEEIEEFEYQIECSQSEIEISDCEIDLGDVLGESDFSLDGEILDVNTIPVCDFNSEKLTLALPNIDNKSNPNLDFVESSGSSQLKETIRDIRVIVEKLPNEISENSPNIEDNDNPSFQIESFSLHTPSNLCSKISRQVARKKTGGVFIKNTQNPDIIVGKEEKVIQQLSSKDGDFIPSVFDKMTRAGKRDLERAIKESTANLVMQKTTQIISDKVKEIHADSSSSEDEEIQKTAEIVTNTILKFLTKTKSKKLEKLGKDITDEIANKINNFKFNVEDNSSIEEPTSTQLQLSSNKLTSPVGNIEKKVEHKFVKSSDKTEENIPRRVTRETSRQIAQQNKNAKKSSPNSRKTLAEQFEEIERVERDIINCELSASLLDEEVSEPRRPETRNSRQKQNENLKGISENDPSLEVKRLTVPKRKSITKSKKKVAGKNGNKQQKSISSSGNLESSLTEGELIDGQFLIDTELNVDSVLSVGDADLSKLSKTTDSSFTDCTILKASADSTTTENGLLNNESANELICEEEHLLLSTKSIEDVAEKNFVISDMKNISESVFNESISPTKPNRKNEECKSKYLKEDNLKQNSTAKSSGNDGIEGELTRIRDSEKIGNTGNNKEKLQAEVVSKTSKNNFEDMSKKHSIKEGRESCERKERSATESLVDTSSDSQIKSDKKPENEDTIRSEQLSAEDSESTSEPFKVLNDMITDIEKSMLLEEIKTEGLMDKQLSFNSGLGTDSDKACTSEAENQKHKESPSHKVEASADSTSFLNYSIDDSFRLMIDEGNPDDDLTEKDMDLDTSMESNENNELIKENNESKSSIKLETVTDKTRESESNMPKRNTENVSAVSKNKQVSKPLTNEEKIAQLTRRDPRLVNEKKIVNVLMRDPRIRNKLPKVEEGREKPPEFSVLDSPLSPDPEKEVSLPKSFPIPNPQEIDEKNPIPRENRKSDVRDIKESRKIEVPDPKESKKPEVPDPKQSKKPEVPDPKQSKKPEVPDPTLDANRKKKLKKRIDEELVYKTPLSDLHDANTEGPTYERNIKKKRNTPSGKKGREVEEEIKPPRRNRAQEELKEEGSSFIHPPKDSKAEGYYNREPSYDKRNFMRSNTEESNRRLEGQYSGEKFETRNYYQEDRTDFHPGPRSNYEQEAYVRRTRNEENFSVTRDRNDFPDNHIYSRREFYRRNKYAHDHDHFGNSSRLMDARPQENQFFPQQNCFAVPPDNAFRISAYPPVSMLPDPMYSQVEEFDQSFGNMDTDSFSPPSTDLCPPPPLIRSPSPNILRRDNYCPSPPRIGRDAIPNERDYEEYNRGFHKNYERDERSYSGRNHCNRDNGNSNDYRGGNHRRGNRWESPPRKRFVSDYQRGRDDRGRLGRSPSWSPERLGGWQRERSLSPPREQILWDSPRTRTPSPPRWHDNYRERMPHKSYPRYN